MRFKLDENLSALRIRNVFVEAGYDVQSVRDENLGGSSDERIYAVCQGEGRCLVTLDLDFSDLLRFTPQTSAGIVILRPGREASLALLVALARQLIAAVADRVLEGHDAAGELGVAI